MIKQLAHSNIEVSKKIRAVFQVSYAVEAELLNAIDFPPLKRTLNQFSDSPNEFYGYWKEAELAAVIELKKEERFIHIQSLVVDPTFFRQGLAKTLLHFVFDSFDATLFMVETGVANKPAIELYKKFQFREVRQWDTDYGIRKIRFERTVLA